MNNGIFRSFLEQSCKQGLALARDSDVLDLTPIGDPPQRYLARYRCRGLIRDRGGAIVETDGEFHVGIWFHDGYLDAVSVPRLLTWLAPFSIFHSNIRPPLICLHITPGTELISILHKCYELITWQTHRTDDGLDGEACQWARNHLDRLPIDPRPLKRRLVDTALQEKPEES